jgi:hypothetical protein
MFRISLDGAAAATHVLNVFSSSWDSAANILGRRAGRIAFGTVLVVGMLAIVTRVVHDEGVWGTFGGPFAASTHSARLDAARTLAGVWFWAAVAYAVVRFAVWWIAPLPRGGALLRASLVVPAVGLALALPLTAHALWFAMTGGDFDAWVRLSIAVVGFAHVVFALTFGIRAAELARTPEPTMGIGNIFLWSVSASVIPWGLLLLPETLTLVTGVALLPVLHLFTLIARREREALPTLPTARIV